MIRLLAAGLTGALLIAAAPAFAQGIGDPAQFTSPPLGGARAKSNQERNAAPVPPPALPGARTSEEVAPAARGAADLAPTEALFDAINRGDLATAKDAVSRGADLNGTNVLGLTPLDLSIDLGRNQISFFLLSLRGASGFSVTGGPPPSQQAASAKPSRAERLATARADRASRQQATAAAAPATPPTPRNARLFAGDGGAPVPQAGFLGFGGTR